MTATVTRISRSYPRSEYEADFKHPEPTDPPITTKTDKAAALFIWVGGLFASLAIIAGLGWLAIYLKG